MKRILISVLVLVVLATLGLFVGQWLKQDEGPPSDTSSEDPDDRVYNMVDQMPRQINNVEYQYPKDALNAGLGGTVHIKMIISKEGLVESAEVSVGSGVPSLDQAALTTAKLCKFTPPLVNGKPVRMRLFKPFVFDVNNVPKRHPDER